MSNINGNKTCLPEKADEYINGLIKERGLENVKVEVKPAIAKGNNFMGVLNRVLISGMENNENVEIRLIVKSQVTDESMMSNIPLSEIFRREIFIYTDLKKTIEELQEALPSESKFVFPECYFTDIQDLGETIIMEDLTSKNFDVFPGLKRVDLEHATIILKHIGKLHALSFVLQTTQPEEYKKITENLGDILYKTWSAEEAEEDVNKYLNYHLDGVLAALESEDHKERVKKFGEDILRRVLDAVDSGPPSAIIHGDCWTSNMLFKYEEGKPVDIRFVDYQLTRYAAPVLDVLYFIFCCTDGKLREDHYDDMLEMYYGSLSEQLSAFSLSANAVYPRRVFYEQVKKFSLSVLALVSFDLSLMTRDEEKTQELSEVIDDVLGGTEESASKSSPLFKERINDLIRDFVKYGYL